MPNRAEAWRCTGRIQADCRTAAARANHLRSGSRDKDRIGQTRGHGHSSVDKRHDNADAVLGDDAAQVGVDIGIVPPAADYDRSLAGDRFMQAQLIAENSAATAESGSGLLEPPCHRHPLCTAQKEDIDGAHRL